MADGAQQDRVVLAELVDTVLRHHRALLEIPFAPPVERRVLYLEAFTLRDVVEQRPGLPRRLRFRFRRLVSVQQCMSW